MPIHADVRPRVVDTQGNPVVNGTVYFGKPNADTKTNPVNVWSDPNSTTNLGSSLQTNAYGQLASAVFVFEPYSIVIENAAGDQIDSVPYLTGIPDVGRTIATSQAAVKALTLADGDRVTLVSGSNSFDYVYDASSTATDDAGTVLTPDSGPGRLIYQENGPIPLEVFAPTADGTTDDATAVGNFFTSLGSSGKAGCASGTYAISTVSSTLTDCSLKLAGAKFVAIGTSTSPAIELTGTDFEIDGLNVTNAGGYETGRSKLIRITSATRAKIGSLSARYTSQHLPVDSNSGSPRWQLDNDDRAIRVEDCDDCTIGLMETVKADVAIRVRDCSGCEFGRVRIETYMKGLRIDGGTHNTFKSAVIKDKTPTFVSHLRTTYNDWREDRPGNNGVLLGEGVNRVNIRNLTLEDFTIHNSGEHGIRCAGAADAFRVHIVKPKIKSVGSAGIKILTGSSSDHYFDSVIDQPVIIDCDTDEAYDFNQASAGFTQAVFETTGDTITLTGGSWPEDVAGKTLTVTGTASNNASIVVTTRDSDTQITCSTNLTNETATAASFNVPNQNKNSDGIMCHRVRRFAVTSPLISNDDNDVSCLNGISVFDAVDLTVSNPIIRRPQAHGIEFDPAGGDITRFRMQGGEIVGDGSNSSSGLYLNAEATTLENIQILGHPYIQGFTVGVNIRGTATAIVGPSVVSAMLESNTTNVASNNDNWMCDFKGEFTNDVDFRDGSMWQDYTAQEFKVLKSSVWTAL